MKFANNAVWYLKEKINTAFRKLFREQTGGAEIIATLIIIAVVVVLALAFRDKLSSLVKSLWNNMTNLGEENASAATYIPQWD